LKDQADTLSRLQPVPNGGFKVCVVGGAGGIGQPLSLLMAQCPLVSELAIIDLNVAMVPAAGVQADLSHIEGKCKVTSTVLTLNQDKAVDKAGAALTGCFAVMVLTAPRYVQRIARHRYRSPFFLKHIISLCTERFETIYL